MKERNVGNGTKPDRTALSTRTLAVASICANPAAPLSMRSAHAAAAVDVLMLRRDLLAALAAEAGFVVLDPTKHDDFRRLCGAMQAEGMSGHLDYYAARILDRLVDEQRQATDV